MKKINFVNNREPAISAENLNQMQDNIEDAINENVICITTSSNQSNFADTTNYYNINFDTLIDGTYDTNLFTHNSKNGTITCNFDGFIKISSVIKTYCANDGIFRTGLYLNDSKSTFQSCNKTVRAREYNTFNYINFVKQVSNGDTISPKVRVANTNDIVASESYFTIEKIER